jgi:hypothetical protein
MFKPRHISKLQTQRPPLLQANYGLVSSNYWGHRVYTVAQVALKTEYVYCFYCYLSPLRAIANRISPSLSYTKKRCSCTTIPSILVAG